MPWVTLQIRLATELRRARESARTCVRMDGGMGGGIKVKTQTKPRPWAKFPAASKFF